MAGVCYFDYTNDRYRIAVTVVVKNRAIILFFLFVFDYCFLVFAFSIPAILDIFFFKRIRTQILIFHHISVVKYSLINGNR